MLINVDLSFFSFLLHLCFFQSLQSKSPHWILHYSIAIHCIVGLPLAEIGDDRADHGRLSPSTRQENSRMASEKMMSQTYSSTGLNTAPRVSDGPDIPDLQRQWMVQFCVEPPGDLATCCLSWWVPCAQYGKTNWRLKRQFLGEDPTDATWKSAYGCNGACWVFWGLECCCGHLGAGEPLSFLQPANRSETCAV